MHLLRTSSVPETTGAKFDSEVAEASLKTENSILHDHMYNRLEEAIGQAIQTPEGYGLLRGFYFCHKLTA